MKKSNNITEVVITLVCIIVALASLIAIFFSASVLSNKSKSAFDELSETDRLMFRKLDEYLTNEDGTKKKLDKPIALMSTNGLWHGRAYVFGVNVTEHKLAYGLSGGTYAAEILIPDEYSFPTVYRMSTFGVDLGSFLFPSDFNKVNFCNADTFVITYSEKTLNDGTFNTLMDKYMAG